MCLEHGGGCILGVVSNGGAPMPASTPTFIMWNFPAHMKCEVKHNEDMEWDIYGLNGWGIYGKVSYCFRVIRSKNIYMLSTVSIAIAGWSKHWTLISAALNRLGLLIVLRVSSLPFLAQLRRNVLRPTYCLVTVAVFCIWIQISCG